MALVTHELLGGRCFYRAASASFPELDPQDQGDGVMAGRKGGGRTVLSVPECC